MITPKSAEADLDARNLSGCLLDPPPLGYDPTLRAIRGMHAMTATRLALCHAVQANGLARSVGGTTAVGI